MTFKKPRKLESKWQNVESVTKDESTDSKKIDSENTDSKKIISINGRKLTQKQENYKKIELKTPGKSSQVKIAKMKSENKENKSQ